jgi:hypothetical protein
VEPDRGEDCDTFDVSGMPCRPRTSPELQCRLDCSGKVAREADGIFPAAGECANGWGCGVDDVCRTSKGTFELTGAPLPETAGALLIGDFDHDNRKDLLSTTNSELIVHYADGEGIHDRSVVVPTGGTYPAVGDLNGDGTDDFTLNVGGGLGVLLGQQSRELIPAAFPMHTDEDVTNLRFVPTTFTTPSDNKKKTRDFVVRHVDGVDDVDDTWKLAPRKTPMLPNPVEIDLPGTDIADIAVGRAEPAGLTCDKIVIALRDTRQIQIHSPCGPGGAPLELNNQPSGFPQTITLPDEVHPDRVFLYDDNGDGALDLVIGVQIGKAFAIVVAHHQLAGFYGQPIARYTVPLGKLLAMGDLDGDAMFDFVTSEGIFAGAPVGMEPTRVEVKAANTFHASEAVIGDFNGNGVSDVVVGSVSSVGLDFYNGVDQAAAGGVPYVFNHFRVSTQGQPEKFVVGDFDGDLLLDLAFADAPLTVTGDALSDRFLSVAFGSPYGAPESAVHIGHFDRGIAQIVPFSLMEPWEDAASEIGVVAERLTGGAESTTEWTINAIQGSGDRQLFAPFLLGDMDANPPGLYLPMRSFVGRFDASPTTDDRTNDLALLTTTYTTEKTPPDGFYLWQVPVEAEALTSIDPTNQASHAVALENVPFAPQLVGLTDGVVGNVDESDGDTDELVLSLPTRDPNTNVLIGSRLVVERPEGGLWKPSTFLQPSQGFIYISLRLADIDRDKHLDLAAIQVEVTDLMSAPPKFTTRPVVFWGDGAGGFSPPVQASKLRDEDRCVVVSGAAPSQLESLSLAVLEAGVIPPPSKPDGSTTAESDGAQNPQSVERSDLAKEIVFVDLSGTYVVEVKMPEKSLLPPRCLEDVVGGHVVGGHVVAGADLTGDGVDDLIVGATGSTYFYRGVSRLP